MVTYLRSYKKKKQIQKVLDKINKLMLELKKLAEREKSDESKDT